MKNTLHDFFTRTAYSKDASEHLMRFHRLPKENFLLLIPTHLKNKSEIKSLVNSIKYLFKLDLIPTLLLSEHFFNKPLYSELLMQIRKIYKNVDKSFIITHKAQKTFLARLEKLSSARQFYKYLVIHPELKDTRGKICNRIHLNNSSHQFNKATTSFIQWLHPFLKSLGPAYAIQVASSDHLLPELFTTKGAGSFISLGYQFVHLQKKDIPKEPLTRLIESGFNQTLKANYFSSLGKNWHALIEKEYRGAVVLKEYKTFTYLDKIVVSPEYYGRGLGSLLFDELFNTLKQFTENKPKLAWRARHDNPFLTRYANFLRQAAQNFPLLCGTTIDADYVYHTLGLNPAEKKSALKIMRHQPSSFKKS